MHTDTSAFSLRRLGSGDLFLFRQMLKLFEQVFAMDTAPNVSDSYVEQLLATPSFFGVVAIHNSVVIGGATAYELPMYYSQQPELFIYDMAVSPAYQRKGVGSSLISTLKQHCRERDIACMFVEAHEEDSHAVEFYRSTGGSAESVVHFTYAMKA